MVTADGAGTSVLNARTLEHVARDPGGVTAWWGHGPRVR
jgi:hypothetical protein